VLHPNGRKDAVCQVCNIQFSVVASRPGLYCSRACLGTANGKRQEGRDPSKRTTTACLECGAAFEALLSLGDRRKFCSRPCNALWHMRRRRILRPTSIELALKTGLALVGVATVPEVRIGRFLVDLAIPAAKIAIEADGSYWHSLRGMAERDARKDAALSAAGWRVLRFGEDQINTDVASCVAAVLAALGVRR
jgi:very-short-patch-repair endonuclease